MTIGSALIASTAHMFVETLGATPSVTGRLHARLARGLAEMADAQIDDIANSNRDPAADTVFAPVAGKTGAECALFAVSIQRSSRSTGAKLRHGFISQ